MYVTHSYTLYDICMQYYELLKCLNYNILQFNIRSNRVKIENLDPTQPMDNSELHNKTSNININICSIELNWDGKITKIWYDNDMRWIRIMVWNGGDL